METNNTNPEPSFQEIFPDGTAFEMIYVEGGDFLMGSDEEEAYNNEKPVHQVELSGYYIGKYPVTQALWKAVMKGNPSFFIGDTRRVETVSWEDTQAFLQKLNKQTGKAYQLPTEAEWEYAARGRQAGNGYRYAGSNKLKEVGWYDENSHFETKAVGLKYPNELGIFDMSGNVWEWCQDWYSGDYYKECKKQGIVENPQGPAEGSGRVLRGGSWSYDARICRCSFRISDDPGSRSNGIGFRLVLPVQSVG